MNTRSSSVGQKNSSFNKGRGPRGSSASLNNISIELCDNKNNSKAKSKVVHSPAVKETEKVQRTASLSSIPSQTLFHDIQIMEDQDIFSQPPPFVPPSGRNLNQTPNIIPSLEFPARRTDNDNDNFRPEYR